MWPPLGYRGAFLRIEKRKGPFPQGGVGCDGGWGNWQTKSISYSSLSPFYVFLFVLFSSPVFLAAAEGVFLPVSSHTHLFSLSKSRNSVALSS
jgi:hypothetical protein